MKSIFIYCFLSLLSFSCESTYNCINKITFEREKDGPSPDLIILETFLSEEYVKKFPMDKFLNLNFHIDENNSFSTHDWLLKKENNNYFFYIRTTFFNRKKDFKEIDFYNLINLSKSLKVEIVDGNDKFTFIKCN
ncbi:hypothetical protein FIA58_021080 [Flavobacterium jejuense]|uniref:Lipoprotein n=1 Tax=Flavobacterium jejuense TaxID=1544455 RepID=A0ABX0IW68_9FLAO|nr:hypothetical protein [Flavobacterium jejuense]NHN28175.1 hypothetical protein [Flavobacterium jejuense]